MISAGILIICIVVFYITKPDVRMGVWTDMWNMKGAYKEQGFLLSTVHNMRYLQSSVPNGYSKKNAENIIDKIKADTIQDENKIIPKNLIVIQCESLTDYYSLGNLETDGDCLEYLHTLKETASTGTLYTSSYGGGTADTEWEFLTGNTLVFLSPSIVPYQVYVKENTVSLAKILKNRGYKAVAMHANIAKNWNRETVFQNMGFDEFADVEAYKGKEIVRDFYSDKANAEMIIETYEKYADEPLFLFNITMQNHGGYDYSDFETTVHIKNSDKIYEDVEQFLTLEKLTDESFKMLTDYFEEIDEPTMIVIYGDHQPSLNTEFCRYLYGKPIEELQGKEALNFYQTPIVIWTNYEKEVKDLGDMSAGYLAAVVMKEAGLELTGYQKFLLSEMEKFPILTTRGCLDAQGELTGTEDEKLNEYKILQYNNLFDSKGRLEVYE